MTSRHEPPAFVKSLLAPPDDAGSAMWDEVAALHDNDALLPIDQLSASLRRIARVLSS